MKKNQIKVATLKDIDQCIAVIVLAFGNEPGARWMYPDPYQYIANFPEFVKIFSDKALAYGSAHYIDQFLAAAFWLPPQVRTEQETLVELISNSVSEKLRYDIFELFEKLNFYHPKEPHWHLPLIGTDPTHQGKGYGSALLAYALNIFDQNQAPAFLEATSEKSVRIYQRKGFEVLDTVQVGNSPHIFPMLRKPIKK